MRMFIASAAMLAASPAFAASSDYGLISLRNTDFVVFIGLAVFVGIVVYYKVPSIVMGMLDKRADDIRSDLDEARALRDEAQTLLASYERKQREMEEEARRIVKNAREEAEAMAEQGKADIEKSIKRRMENAENQIASAQAAAIKDVRDRAAVVAIAAARDVVTGKMSEDASDKLIDSSIDQVGARLH